MQYTVTTGKDGRVEVWLNSEGRLVDADGQFLFTDKVFVDEWDADLYLASDPDARFCFAYMSVDWRRYVVV